MKSYIKNLQKEESRREFMATFAVSTLGCKVNLYESEGYIDALRKKGLKQVDFKENADIYIINTCAVTNTAASKSRQKIHQAQRQNENAVICVVGCLIQTTKQDLGADLLIGSSLKHTLADRVIEVYQNKTKLNLVEDISTKKEFENLHVNSFSEHTRAFLKIQDGCNQFCSYCIIPYARGRERSMPVDEVIASAKQLVQAGHKEIVLSGIHTGRYGNDINTNLTQLLKELIKIDGLLRIRISSIEMNEVTDELLDLMEKENKITPHLHIPVQSACNRTLKMMNRPYTIEWFIERINAIRNRFSTISISTDLILGFPDEREEDYQETLNNLKKINFSFMHLFPYSKRDGTKACEIKNHLQNSVKKARVREVLEYSKNNYSEYMKTFIGSEVEVLFEYEKDGYLFGHTGEYVPLMAKLDASNLNTIQKVKVTSFKNEVLYSE